MKSSTIMRRIKEKGTCTIAACEKLTYTLICEGKLNPSQAIRFRPLHGDFDIINSDYYITGTFNPDLCCGPFNIDELMNKFM